MAVARVRGICPSPHRALSLAAGVASNAVGRIVRGELYPELATLARLEVTAQEPVYPQGLVSGPATAGWQLRRSS